MADETRKTAEITPLRGRHPCPICGQAGTRQDYPFCSRRCANIDLNAWFDGRYAIATEEDDDGVREP